MLIFRTVGAVSLLLSVGCADDGAATQGGGGGGSGQTRAEAFVTAYCETRLGCRGAEALESFYGRGTFDACFEAEKGFVVDSGKVSEASADEALAKCAPSGEVCLVQACLDCARDVPNDIDRCVADAGSWVEDICGAGGGDSCPGQGMQYP